MRWPGFIKGGIFDPFPHDVGKLWKKYSLGTLGIAIFPQQNWGSPKQKYRVSTKF
jgi:hypothetical protein